MIDALEVESDWINLISTIGEPTTLAERVSLVSALIRTDRLNDPQRRLNEDAEMDIATRQSLQERLEAKELMRQS